MKNTKAATEPKSVEKAYGANKMKSILISIKPEWVCKILNGEKTVEVRKTAPKCELPIDVYIYCTKDRKEKLCFVPSTQKFYSYPKDSFIAERLKDMGLTFNGEVVAKFTLRKVERLERYAGVYIPETILHTDSIQTRYSMEKKSCLSMDEIWEYTNGNGYAWHISDLEIFDKPKELEEFYGTPKKINGLYGAEMVNISLSKAPQSWCYVEVEK